MPLGIFRRPTDDMVGHRFGRLTVLARVERPDSSRAYCWLCRCDCGVEKIVRGINLRIGNTRSCGCKKRSRVAVVGEPHPAYRANPKSHRTGHRRCRELFPGNQTCSVVGCSRIAERHHVDGNPLNNAPENVQFLCHKHHMAHPHTRAQMSAGRRRKLAEQRAE